MPQTQNHVTTTNTVSSATSHDACTYGFRRGLHGGCKAVVTAWMARVTSRVLATVPPNYRPRLPSRPPRHRINCSVANLLPPADRLRAS